MTSHPEPLEAVYYLEKKQAKYLPQNPVSLKICQV